MGTRFGRVHRVHRVALGAVLLALGITVPAAADPVEYRVHWVPSPSAGVEGYELTLHDFHGLSERVVDLGLPPITAGIMRRTVTLDRGVAQLASLRAYGGGSVSGPSNEIIILPSPGSAPSAGLSITSVAGLSGVVSGEVVVVAETSGAVESVSFAVDGVPYRIENQAPWSLAGDAGETGSEQAFDTTFLQDGPHVLEVVAWSDDGAQGQASAPFGVSFDVDNSAASNLPAPPLPPIDPTPGPGAPPQLPAPAADVVVGLYVIGDGLHLLRMDGSSELLYRYHLIGNYEARPVWCDLDSDGDRDLVIGFGPGSLSRVMLLTLDGFEVVGLQVIQGTNDRYAEAWGETFPGCGDVDGDGRIELAIGMGPWSEASITMLDDVETGWATMPGTFRTRVLTLPSPSPLGADYLSTGVAKPVLGDIDGDGRDELVVARSEGGIGTVSVLDDAKNEFAVMPRLSSLEGLIELVSDEAYRSADGSTDVAVGDVDGDGRDEIVVAVSRGGLTGIDVYDDAFAQYGLLVDSGVQAASGAALEVLKPTLADPDRDGRLEIGVAMGDGSDRVQLIDDGDAGFTAIESGTASGGYDVPADADAFWPAIEANP